MSPLISPVHNASSISEFLDIVRALPKRSSEFLTYRGERDDTWEIAPGILRPGMGKALEHERDLIRDLMSIHPGEFRDDQTMFDRLVRMQHYNLPTRLMDVTANPLVALYFASGSSDPRISPPVDGRVSFITVPNAKKKYYDSDAVSCISNLANMSSQEMNEIRVNMQLPKSSFNSLPVVDRLIQFIKAEKPAFRSMINSKDLETVFYVQPKLSNRRILAQNGAFLIFGVNMHGSDRRDSSEKTIWFQMIRIPHQAKASIRAELDGLGINQSSLFPEIENASNYILKRYM